MDRKNINRGFKKLRVWQDAISLYVLNFILRIVIIMNRKAGLNFLVHAATEAIQQWARDIKKTRMGTLIVIHTFGGDMKWHPHIHLIVIPLTAGFEP